MNNCKLIILEQCQEHHMTQSTVVILQMLSSLGFQEIRFFSVFLLPSYTSLLNHLYWFLTFQINLWYFSVYTIFLDDLIQPLGFKYYLCPVAQMVKRLPTMRETHVRALGWEVPLEKEIATHSRILAWKIPWIEEPSRLQSMGSQRVRHDWETSLHFMSCWLTNLYSNSDFSPKFYPHNTSAIPKVFIPPNNHYINIECLLCVISLDYLK